MELPKQFSQIALEGCHLLKATIELTTVCNFKCGHCYNFDRRNPKLRGIKGLETPTVKAILEQLAELQTVEITFTGGEAALRADLTELVAHASSLHQIVALRSNGSKLSPPKIDELVEAGLQDLIVTLYGFTADSHDPFTGVAGSFDRVIENIQYANQKYPGLLKQLTLATLSHNEHELHLRRQLEDRLAFSISPNSICNNRNDLSDNGRLENALNIKSNLNILGTTERERYKLKHAKPGDASEFRCGCARIQLAILANGDVVPCVEAPWVAGNILDSTIRQIWDDSPVFNEIRQLKSKDWTVCHGCPLTVVCSRRNCGAYKQRGVYTDPDPFEGELTYQRFKNLGYEEPPCLDFKVIKASES